MLNKMRSNVPASSGAEPATDSWLLGVMRLLKDDVYDAAGKPLGEIEEIIIDIRSGCVRHVVLALGGFLGIRQQRLAVPWSALHLDANYHRCIVDVAQMRLMGVPMGDH